MIDVELDSRIDHVMWGRLPCEATPPVMDVASGSVIAIDTISHEGILEDQGRDPIAFLARYGVPRSAVQSDAIALARSDIRRNPDDGPHVVTGPIYVQDARVGDVLQVEFLEFTPRCDYGFVSSRHGRGALPGEYPSSPESVFTFCRADLGAQTAEIGSPARVRFPINPFLGIVGVGVPGRIAPSSRPPGPHGGNIDLRHLVAGSTLYLPILVPGALFYVGDPHFAQGDGEVALTALEAPLRARVRLTVLRGERAHACNSGIVGPVAETAEHLIALGMHVDLDEAMRRSIRNAITMVSQRTGLDSKDAYAYLSAAGDFALTQVVDGVVGVHGMIRKADLL